jgi:hypothetical protein
VRRHRQGRHGGVEWLTFIERWPTVYGLTLARAEAAEGALDRIACWGEDSLDEPYSAMTARAALKASRKLLEGRG